MRSCANERFTRGLSAEEPWSEGTGGALTHLVLEFSVLLLELFLLLLEELIGGVLHGYADEGGGGGCGCGRGAGREGGELGGGELGGVEGGGGVVGGC